MNKIPLIIAGVGLLAGALAAASLEERSPRHYWLIGIAALFPAWLVAFLAVIAPASRSPVDVPLPPRALLSSSAGLIGIIATDYFLRRAQQSGRVLTRAQSWVLGVLALVPAWLIAII